MSKFFTHSPLQVFCTTALVMLSIAAVNFLLGFAGPMIAAAMAAAKAGG